MLHETNIAPLPTSPWSARLKTALTMLLLASGGMLFGYLTAEPIQSGLSAMVLSLTGTEPHAFWELSRAAAFVAFVFIWLSMAFGLAITNRTARLWPGGPAAADLHEYTSLMGLAFGGLHALILLGDRYSNYTLTQLLVPFAGAQYRPVWVGLGQIGLYVGMLVSFTFYVRRQISYRWWRALHYLSFAMFGMILFHGLFSGTDSSILWVRGLYALSGLSILGLTAYRIAVTRRQNTPPAAPNRVAPGARH